jgi:hypothetical protein
MTPQDSKQTMQRTGKVQLVLFKKNYNLLLFDLKYSSASLAMVLSIK